MTTVCDLVTATDLNKALSVAEERYCICVICLLADDSCNRAKVRKSGAFKHLLRVAKNTDNDPLLTMVREFLDINRMTFSLIDEITSFDLKHNFNVNSWSIRFIFRF